MKWESKHQTPKAHADRLAAKHFKAAKAALKVKDLMYIKQDLDNNAIYTNPILNAEYVAALRSGEPDPDSRLQVVKIGIHFVGRSADGAVYEWQEARYGEPGYWLQILPSLSIEKEHEDQERITSRRRVFRFATT